MQLANDVVVELPSYAWLEVNVQGVVARVKAFVVPAKLSYDLLLSRRWTSRVKAMEEHSTNTLTIRGSDGIPRVVHGRPDPSTEVDRVSSIRGSGLGSGELLGLENEEAEDAVLALLDELDYDADSASSASGNDRRRA